MEWTEQSLNIKGYETRERIDNTVVLALACASGLLLVLGWLVNII